MTAIVHSSLQQGPFGNTDAARVDLSNFIAINGLLEDPRRNPLAMQDRVIVGRKGSGKTLYLRKLQDEAHKRDLLTLSEYDALSTETVVYFLKRIREYVQSIDRTGDFDIFVNRRNTVVSVWKSVWERAIFLSAISLVLSYKRRPGKAEFSTAPHLRLYKNISEFEEYLLDRFSGLFDVPFGPTSPQAALRTFSDHFESSRRLQKFINDPRWVKMQMVTKATVAEVPPMAIYVDAIDDDFEDAPEAWLTCQLGLYRAVAQSGFTNESFAGRVHVVAALRDIVYAAALRTEHSTRHYQNTHIKSIEWDGPTIKRFFAEKLRQVTSRSISSQSSAHGLDLLIRGWIGFSDMVNGRNMGEDVLTYILRHGRMLPRDIILFGNAIEHEKDRRTVAGAKFESASLRKAVSEAASVVGMETISVCMNEMLSNSDLFSDFIAEAGARAVQYVDVRRFLEAKVEIFFRDAKNEIISREQLNKAIIASQINGAQDFEEGAASFYRLDNLLWRHGMLAYEDTSGSARKWRFNWKGTVSSDVIPPKAEKFGFHASVIDVYGIKASSEGPVH